MDASSDCPSEQTLLDYAAGQLTESRLVGVEDHLMMCLRCNEALAWIRTHLIRPSSDPEADLESEALSDTGRLPGDIYTEMETHAGEGFGEEKFDFSVFDATQREDALGRLGNYEILEVVGHGGMGVVFKAYDATLRRTVAIKALHRGLANSPRARRRFIREARAAAAINHPNVVTIYSVEEHCDQPFLVMQYIEGGSLRDRLRCEKRLDPIDALRLSAQVASALAAAHAQGVIHRDIKPGNIMLADGIERVLITDFGLARAAIDSVELTSVELAVGTPAYMAPEQIESDIHDARSDLFQLGCVMYAMLAGHSPFHGKHALDMARKVTDCEPTPLVKANEQTPPFFSEIVAQLLEKEPSRRFPSAIQLYQLLNTHLAIINQTPTDELLARLARTRLPATAGSARITRRSAAICLLAMLVGVAALAFFMSRQRDADAGSPAPSRVSMAPPRVSPDSEWLSGVIRVGRGEEADFSSLVQALRHAGPGAHILVSDDVYEPLVIDRPQQWRDITIESRGKVLSAPAPDPVVRICNTPGVVVRGFQMRIRQGQTGFDITGDCAGVTIENIRARRIPDDPSRPTGQLRAFAYLHDGAAGAKEAPIVLRRNHILDGVVGIVLGEQSPSDAQNEHSVRWVRVEENRIVGQPQHSYLFILTNAVEQIVAERNVFAKGACGLSFYTTHAGSARDVTVRYNTFDELDYFLDLHNSPLAHDRITIEANLITRTQRVTSLPRDLSEIRNWFIKNLWGSADQDPQAERLLGSPARNVSYESEDPDDADYLKPRRMEPESPGPPSAGHCASDTASTASHED